MLKSPSTEPTFCINQEVLPEFPGAKFKKDIDSVHGSSSPTFKFSDHAVNVLFSAISVSLKYA